MEVEDTLAEEAARGVSNILKSVDAKNEKKNINISYQLNRPERSLLEQK